MSEKSLYRRYYWKNVPSAIRERLFHKQKSTKSFCGYKNLNAITGGHILASKILTGESFCAIRFGGSELSALNGYEKKRLGIKKEYKEIVKTTMKNNAGFYPADEEHLDEYAKYYFDHARNCDILAISGLHMEDYFYKKLMNGADVISNWAMEPLLGGWSSALEGKRVLVISPFEDEIKKQYAKREKLFIGHPEILPEFELITLKVPLTLGDEKDFEFPTFMDALEDMKKKINKINFDIALVGAGAYGSLLAIHIKEIGKAAIQCGGATQTLFGIIGKRWENRDHVKQFVNEDWIHPSSKPEGYEKIEGGAYW